jgi:hypothetical protein
MSSETVETIQTPAEVMGEVYRLYRLGEPFDDGQLLTALVEAKKLEDLLYALGERFALSCNEVRQFRSNLESFCVYRGLQK